MPIVLLMAVHYALLSLALLDKLKPKQQTQRVLLLSVLVALIMAI
ncbi:hypothetical protein [uncultured Microscilla sp.]|nr:hypothetical protein [uncultured Microscilla sp.]